jgi:hypothetical protein
MSFHTTGRIALAALTLLLAVNQSIVAQTVVINEIVEDEQDFESTDISPDTREFVEFYNATAAPIDISGWTLDLVDLGVAVSDPPSPPLTHDIMPAGSTIPAHGYFVIGAATVPNVNYSPFDGELWPNSTTNGSVWELRNPNLAGETLVDAVALDTFRSVELANATQAQLNQIAAGQTVGPDARGGWWGQVESENANAPNRSMSVGRYLDGRDTNINGRDFGYIPVTPGASNNLPQVASYTVPNADSMAVGTLDATANASFKLPYVIDPAQAGPAGLGGQDANPKAIVASPQGGKALVAWDETGGGNVVYSDKYVNKFAISAYIETRPIGAATATARIQAEHSIYGIGTSDPFFSSPDPTGLRGLASAANGSTGIGWVIERVERFGDADFDEDSDVDGNDFLIWQRGVIPTGTLTGTNATGDANADTNVDGADLNFWKVATGAAGGGEVATTKTILLLVDMNDGGDSVPGDNDWQVIKAYDLSKTTQAWHTLGVDYDPATGAVIATFDSEIINFNTQTGLVGNFYAGYREELPGAGGVFARPPTYDLVATGGAGAVPEPASALIVACGALALAGVRRERRANRR